MTTTNPTNSNSSSHIYGSKSGGNQKATNVTDVFFADALSSEYQKTQSVKDKHYDNSVKESSVQEKQAPETDKSEKREPQRADNQDDNQPVDDVQKTDDQPKTEESKPEKNDNKENKTDENDKANDVETDDEKPLDTLAGQPEAMTNRQQAMEAMAVLQVEADTDVVLDDQDVDVDLEINTDIESNKQDKTIRPLSDQDAGKTDKDTQAQNADKTADKTEQANVIDINKAKEAKAENPVDSKVDNQADTNKNSDIQNDLAGMKKEQSDTQQVKTDVQINDVKDESTIEVKSDEIRVENNAKDKKVDYKEFKQDQYSSQEQMSQQSSDFAGMDDKNSNRDKGFDRGENVSKISFTSAASGENKNIQQTLGLDKASDKMDIDASKNVDNIVKSVKTMVSNNTSSMVIRLDPPELGEMRINIRSGSDGMTIEIQAANAKSQQMLQQNSGQLRSALESSGINVNNVDIQFKPDMKNDANAGSNFQDDQSNMFDQNANQNMADSGGNPDDTFQQNFNSWTDGAEFEDAEFSTVDTVEATQGNSEQWQEISFDAVNVLI